MKCRFLYLIIGIIIWSNNTQAQYYFKNDKYYFDDRVFEVSGGFSILNCLTDIGGNKGLGKPFIKDLNINKTSPGGNIGVSINFKEKFTLRLDGTFGSLQGSDSVLRNKNVPKTGRLERNLSFKTSLAEVALLAEAYPIQIIGKYNYDEPPMFSPYVVAGAGMFWHNPKTKLDGRWVALQPLKTEGQGFAETGRKNYTLNNWAAIMGVGLRYEISANLSVKAEFLYRKLFTDYLDDVSTTYIDPALFSNYLSGSQLSDALALADRRTEIPLGTSGINDIRGNSKNNDAFFSSNFKVVYSIGRTKINKLR
jgi:opacity protein-like surface antigen